MGCDVSGIDILPQPRYESHFQEDASFVQGDALDMETVLSLGPADCYFASPPCSPSSTLTHLSVGAKDPQLIPATKRLLQAIGAPWIIENVPGSESLGVLHADVTLRNCDFGLPAYRARVFESPMDLVNELDSTHLQRRMCLGSNNHVPKLDEYGRRAHACCPGNASAIWSHPKNSQLPDWEKAMGVGEGTWGKEV